MKYPLYLNQPAKTINSLLFFNGQISYTYNNVLLCDVMVYKSKKQFFFTTFLNLNKNKGNNQSIINKDNNLPLKINMDLFRYILKNKTWPSLHKFKKYICKEHCKDFSKYHLIYQKKWENLSGVYKITYLPYRLFIYYGSSKNVRKRVKYHYYNGSKRSFSKSF